VTTESGVCYTRTSRRPIKINHLIEKKNRYLTSCSLGETVLFKESPPSIMVTRNPNWSIEILWYGTGYAKGKMLSPPKRPTWGRLHCWFCLKLIRICSWLWCYWTIPMNISNSGVGKYRTNPKKNMILLTLASVDIFTKKWIWRRNFLCHFFLFILYYYFPFLDGNKKTLHDRFVFNNNRLPIEHIT
jgi:hypothetical protein